MPAANGPFEVKLTPEGTPEDGRMSIDKQFHGDLEATSKGTMIAAMGSVKGQRATWRSSASTERWKAAPETSCFSTPEP
jgi:hypothetical protein